MSAGIATRQLTSRDSSCQFFILLSCMNFPSVKTAYSAWQFLGLVSRDGGEAINGMLYFQHFQHVLSYTHECLDE